jgi:hypothetical protein
MIAANVQDTASYIEALAAVHGVVYARTPSCELAEAANRLVGDNLPPPDATENLITALYWAGIITDEEAVQLHIRYLHNLQAKGLF